MSTPLRKVRGLGAAGSGTGNFIAERVTSIILLLLLPYVVGVFVILAGAPRQVVLQWVGRPCFGVPLAIFLIVSIVHMRAGMQVIIEDYVHHNARKYTLLTLNLLFSCAVGIAAVTAIARILFSEQ